MKTHSFGALQLRQKLAMDRQMTSLLDREILTYSDEIVFERENWVGAFVDYGHAVSFDEGRMTSYRAVEAREGRLFWFVRRSDRKLGYHAARHDPLDAAEEADGAWRGRRAVRQDWDFVEGLAKDLIAGRRRFRVHIEDAFNSPLCPMGIEGFLRSVGLRNVKEISGRFAAFLMKIEPQVGFVIHQAYRRHAGLAGGPQPDAAQGPAHQPDGAGTVV
ncbi:MAG: hypothetical protein QNJ13_02650 [Paracoccaceae bacterium]|nr:hypothetical protein [Paracoccaceae bacterium]